MLQLVHLGATFRSEADVHRPPLWGFSTTVTDYGEVAHAMTDEQIEMMIAGYGRIARMAAEAGFDGCEIHGAHGYLGQQSISPWLNRRSDKWGQDRTLFLRRVIETVRHEIGPGRILGYRTTTDDMRSPEDGGLGVSGAIDSARAILATGEIDVLNTTVGHGGKTYTRAIPSYRFTEAVNMPKARHLGEAIGHQVPMIGVGRIASVGIAESLLQSGACELVAMTRAHIADPDIVAKFCRSEAHRIRPCVGALVCNSRKLAGFSEISCLHNPEVMREHELRVEPAAEPQARHRRRRRPGRPEVRRDRGAARASGPGVRLRRADRGPLRAVERTAASDLASTVDHLTAELALLSVPVSWASPSTRTCCGPPGPTTSSSPRAPSPIPARRSSARSRAQVLSSAEALAPGAEIDRDVLVYDALGANDGALVAEALANGGRRVRLVTPYETVMPYGGISHRMETPDILRRKLAAIYTGAVVGVADGRRCPSCAPTARAWPTWSGDARRDHRAEPARPARRAAARLGLPYTSSATRWPRAPPPTHSGTARRRRSGSRRLRVQDRSIIVARYQTLYGK